MKQPFLIARHPTWRFSSTTDVTLESADISSSPVADPPASHIFPVIKESVTVHKTVADNGGLRLRKVIHADVIDIDEELVAHSVTLTRVPIGREIDGPVDVRYENGLTIIPVVKERLVVRRQLVLVEEIHLGRASHTRRAPQSITVRREEMIVERQSPGSDTWHAEDPGEKRE